MCEARGVELAEGVDIGSRRQIFFFPVLDYVLAGRAVHMCICMSIGQRW